MALILLPNLHRWCEHINLRQTRWLVVKDVLFMTKSRINMMYIFNVRTQAGRFLTCDFGKNFDSTCIRGKYFTSARFCKNYLTEVVCLHCVTSVNQKAKSGDNSMTSLSLRAGFECARGNPIRFHVQRLNHFCPAG